MVHLLLLGRLLVRHVAPPCPGALGDCGRRVVANAGPPPAYPNHPPNSVLLARAYATLAYRAILQGQRRGVTDAPGVSRKVCEFVKFLPAPPVQVNDWGWRMTVVPIMAKMDTSNLPPPMLDSKMVSLLRICRDCPKEQVHKFKNQFVFRNCSLSCCAFARSRCGPRWCNYAQRKNLLSVRQQVSRYGRERLVDSSTSFVVRLLT